MQPRTQLRDQLESDDILVAPGVYDGISARVVESMGFDSAIITGAGVANSRIGRPDFGLLNLSENAAQARTIVNSVDIPVHADADTGYGNAVNVHHTVTKLEKTGVAAIMIEDQQWPKRCGHMEGKSVISKEEMCGKVEAAADARDATDPDLVIKARTDAAATHSLEEVVNRLNAYVERGADVVFADALLGTDDIKYVSERVNAPLSVNMGYGIRKRPTTPLLSPKELEDAGVHLVSYPRLITGAAVKGMQNSLAALQETEETGEVIERPDLTVGFGEYTELMGLPKVNELEERFAKN